MTGNVLVGVDPRHIDLVWILGREDLPAFPLVGPDIKSLHPARVVK